MVKTWGRAVRGITALALFIGVTRAVEAATATAQTSVTASVAPRTELTLTRDTNSVTRGTTTQVVFDRYDDKDGQADGNAQFMYAPYRSETGKNWHLVDMLANGSSMTLTADVTGTAGTVPLASIMDAFFGGFYGSDGSFSGGTSGAWELLDTFSRTLNKPFDGIAPMNYRLRLAGVPASAAAYTGQVTYTLTSN